MPTRADRNVPRRRIADDRGLHINSITAAVVDSAGRIVVHTLGSTVPTVLKPLGITPAAHQLTEGLLNRVHVLGGTWSSAATLVRGHRLALQFLGWLATTHRIDDLTDKRLAPATVWDGILALHRDGGRQRNLRTFLADTIAELRYDGEAYKTFLHARSLPVEVSRVQGYAPDVADAIEETARKRVGQWYQRHRLAVQKQLGYLPRNWLHLGAEELLSEEAGLCPPQFRVDRYDLAAAMVLLSLIDNKGPNLSTIQSYTCDSVERANEHASFVTGVKARNREVLRTPAPAGGLFSYGGLLEFITAATRVERMFRRRGADFDRLLFVSTGSPRVMNGNDVNAWWRETAVLWDETDLPVQPTLSFRRLRKAALLRGQHNGHGLIGQKEPMERLYLADAVPDVILVPGLLNTQRSMADYWRSKTRSVRGIQQFSQNSSVDPEQADAIDELVRADGVMDVGVAACASNGLSTTDGSKPCGLGPVACFVCPKGFRIPEIIPGLVAAVQFTDNIRQYEPEEWVTGEAALLNSLARKALEQFPPQVVEAVPPEAIANSLTLIACVYMEGRRRD